MAKAKRPPVSTWTFATPWIVKDYHDSMITPGAYSCPTPYGQVILILEKTSTRGGPTVYRVDFTLHHGNRRFWATQKTEHAWVVQYQPKALAKRFVQKLIRLYPELKEARVRG